MNCQLRCHMPTYKKPERNFDLIMGIHSIGEALKNSSRNNYRLVATKESLKELESYLKGNRLLENIKTEIVDAHKVQEFAKKKFKELSFEFQRIPSNMFLESSLTTIYDPSVVYEELLKKECKIFCLDQVTDLHNSAAIIRSAAFFGVDFLVVAQKGSFGISPKFFRIASGAVEHVKIVKCASLPKFLKKLGDMGVQRVAFSEHATTTLDKVEDRQTRCLVMGAEDVGISNAVSRSVDDVVAFSAVGEIKSLNVSVASALAMQLGFTQN